MITGVMEGPSLVPGFQEKTMRRTHHTERNSNLQIDLWKFICFRKSAWQLDFWLRFRLSLKFFLGSVKQDGSCPSGKTARLVGHRIHDQLFLPVSDGDAEMVLHLQRFGLRISSHVITIAKCFQKIN